MAQPVPMPIASTTPTADEAMPDLKPQRLLHISASPRGAESESLALAATFLDAFRAEHPHTRVDHFDLWDGTLPEFGSAAAAAKMAVFAGADPSGDEARAWDQVVSTFRRFDAADAYVFTVPMWNAGVPYILKQFIDVVSQPGLLFSFDPVEGYRGLLTGKRAAVLYTGAVYGPERGPAFGSDFQRTFFEDWLAWSGIRNVGTVSFQPNLAAPDVPARRTKAHSEARALPGRLFSAAIPSAAPSVSEVNEPAERHAHVA